MCETEKNKKINKQTNKHNNKKKVILTINYKLYSTILFVNKNKARKDFFNLLI